MSSNYSGYFRHETCGISFGSCQAIITDALGIKRAAAKIVPKLLNFEQKQRRVDIAQKMLTTIQICLKKFITGNESWVEDYDIKTKAQSSQWKHPEESRPKKACHVRSNVKVLLSVFFDYNGVMHHEFLPPSRAVNREYYLEVICRLHGAIRQKRTELFKKQL